ncbi:hypothetical protein H4R18_000588 [Coemansia javaensis]|uniref:Uncharacterized protein n=1 Tax=Coemansia javaensis TaxID=2761396 RepID=A0A9W8LMV8_9FUNG|nr:hypothetical protein H4R18_000588 [Coemansia javaensis]
MLDRGSGAAEPTPSKLDRFLSRLGRRMTPPNGPLRSRRGISPAPAPAPELGVGDATPARSTAQQKREKIAELRRRREQSLAGQRRQSQYLAMSPGAGGTAPGGASLAALAAAMSPAEPQRRPHAAADPDEDRFFDSPELDLLLQPISVAEAVNVVDPVPPSQRSQERQRLRRPARGASEDDDADDDELDFTISIPSTSLSPMVPLGRGRGLGHGRQRSRTAVFVAGGRPRPHTVAAAPDKAPAPAPAADAGESVERQLARELDRNSALRRELARLDAAVGALETLVRVAQR